MFNLVEMLLESEEKIKFVLSNPKTISQLQNRIDSDNKTPEGLTPERLVRDFDGVSIMMSKCLPWVVKQYINSGFEYTDVDLVAKALEDFSKNISKLENKDINNYSLESLFQAINNVKDQKTSHDLKREAKAGAEKVFEGKRWTIVVPHTKEAAIQYGKNTKWCTASTNDDNKFEYYNSQGPLYILIAKSGYKFQIHFPTGSIANPQDELWNSVTFVDMFKEHEDDDIINFLRQHADIDENNPKNWGWFGKLDDDVYIKGLKKSSEGFQWATKHIPDYAYDHQLAEKLLQEDGTCFSYIPDNIKDEDLVLQAVNATIKEKDRYDYSWYDYTSKLRFIEKFIPDSLKTPELLVKIFDICKVLKMLPEELRTEERCREAVEKYPKNISDVPEKYLTDELIKSVLERDRGALHAFGLSKYLRDRVERIESELKNNN